MTGIDDKRSVFSIAADSGHAGANLLLFYRYLAPATSSLEPRTSRLHAHTFSLEPRACSAKIME